MEIKLGLQNFMELSPSENYQMFGDYADLIYSIRKMIVAWFESSERTDYSYFSIILYESRYHATGLDLNVVIEDRDWMETECVFKLAIAR